MKRKFYKVQRVKGIEFEMPKRSTKYSAGYDFTNPEEVTIEPNKIVYVKTGIKVSMYRNEALILANRSSNPKKKGILLSNGIGLIDADYYNNPDNEGEIAFAFMNITEDPITIQAGEKLGQGFFINYHITEDDQANEERIGGFRFNRGVKMKANFDTTYCINDKCDKKCFRHHSHYEFEKDKDYWQQDYCTEYLERYYNGEV